MTSVGGGKEEEKKAEVAFEEVKVREHLMHHDIVFRGVKTVE